MQSAPPAVVVVSRSQTTVAIQGCEISLPLLPSLLVMLPVQGHSLRAEVTVECCRPVRVYCTSVATEWETFTSRHWLVAYLPISASHPSLLLSLQRVINASKDNQQMHIIPPSTSFFSIRYSKQVRSRKAIICKVHYFPFQQSATVLATQNHSN